MMPVDYAISRTRRDLTVGSMIRYALLLGAAAAVLLTSVQVELVFVALIVAWVVLAYRTAVGSRMAAESPSLIASGQYEEAERRIESAVRSFIPSRAAKLTNLHHLAVLRHVQHRWTESAELSRTVLGYRSPGLASVHRSSRLMLAEALLEMGDLPGVFDAIGRLYHQKLSLSEAVELLSVQLDYQWRVGAWAQMMEAIKHKVQLTELLPSERSAQAQALLALAARKTGQSGWEQFLRRRSELLADIPQLISRRRVLSELWPESGAEVEPPAGVGTTQNNGL